MNNINIINDEITLKKEEKSELYIRIFWEEPRNEWYICTDCETLFWVSETIKNDIKKCLCWWTLKNFYDPKDIESDWRKRSNKEGYIWKIAETLNNELVWFIMGWKSNITDMNKEKLWLDENDLNILISNSEKIYNNINRENIFYAAEIGVQKDYRGLGIASDLYKAREEALLQTWMRYTLVRTTKKSDKPYRWYKNKWFVEVFSYNDAQDRVIMIKQT
jgi:GNAT superfamily N-acetyltransferase